MTRRSPPSDYYRETITIIVDRLTLLTITQACFVALKHPAIPANVTAIVKDALRYFVPEVDDYAPREVLQDWHQILAQPPESEVQ